ncbi:hypothetical protein B5M47_00380 [candidate division CPR3 bacterium 4484_211]|uniref:EVE domain-containing protein n=1 Tax=candidate division CPR3 bacterium 4484_211 TaxID=1968527 RepID=A0A1W9NZN4_UNCC3|nr:MAG: hypothetical protein B5M47_00380 [candidate division CPR3 bacterium 4484_211]
MLNSLQVQIWLVIGSIENWMTALSQPLPVWGLKESYYGQFNSLAMNDLCIFYVKSPIKGVIGVGLVKDKYIDRTNKIWKEEIEKKKVIWPLRFRLQVLNVLPFEAWQGKEGKLTPVSISDLPIIWQIGFQQLPPQKSTWVLEKIRKSWGVSDFIKGATILRMPLSIKHVDYGKEKEEFTPGHKEIQRLLAETGKMQHFFSETEYKLPVAGEDKRLDVVWKREFSGVPTYAFEVEISRNIEKALARLKVAFGLWNTKPRLIVPESDFEKVKFYLDRESKNFRKEFFFFEPEGVNKILTAKLKLRDIEEMYKIW